MFHRMSSLEFYKASSIDSKPRLRKEVAYGGDKIEGMDGDRPVEPGVDIHRPASGPSLHVLRPQARNRPSGLRDVDHLPFRHPQRHDLADSSRQHQGKDRLPQEDRDDREAHSARTAGAQMNPLMDMSEFAIQHPQAAEVDVS